MLTDAEVRKAAQLLIRRYGVSNAQDNVFGEEVAQQLQTYG